MKKVFFVIALIGLALTVLPSFFVFYGFIEWKTHTQFMFAGMIIWFIFASLWMRQKKIVK